MDGLLRRITDRTYQGALSGYTVQVFIANDGWHAAIMTPAPRQFTRIILRAASLVEAAKLARAWIEGNPISDVLHYHRPAAFSA